MIRVTEVETDRTFYITTNITLLELNGLHPFYMYTSAVAAQTVALGPYSTAVSVRLGEKGKAIMTEEADFSNVPQFLILILIP